MGQPVRQRWESQPIPQRLRIGQHPLQSERPNLAEKLVLCILCIFQVKMEHILKDKLCIFQVKMKHILKDKLCIFQVKMEHISKDKLCIFQVKMEHILTLKLIICLKRTIWP